MMPKKRLLALVPEARRYMIQKVICHWLSLVAGIVLWFALGRQLQLIREKGTGNGLSSIEPALLVIALFCILLSTDGSRTGDRGRPPASRLS